MNKIFTCLLLAGLFLSSCDRVHDLQPQRNLDEVIPPAAVNAIRQAYPTATKVRFSVIEKAKIFQSDFELNVYNMSAIVNNVGYVSEMYKETTETTLPDNIKQYLAANYADAEIEHACQQINKAGSIQGYKLLLKTKEDTIKNLVFDATGTLTLQIDGGDDDDDGRPPKMYFIELEDLPQTIKTYLNTTKADYKLIKAATVFIKESRHFSVLISKDLISYEYLFDENGNVLKSSSFGINSPAGQTDTKSINTNELISEIKTYLNKTYKTWKFERGLALWQNGVVQVYNILISSNQKQYSLQFDANGKFLKEEQIGKKDNDNRDKLDIINILPKDLPLTITNYLIAQMKDFKFFQTAIISDKNKKTYWVTIIKGEKTYDYTFDEKGNLISSKEIELKFPENKITEKSLELTEMPYKVKSFLDKNYKNWIFQKGVTVWNENKILGYKIAIKVENDYYYINFDDDANFMIARKG